MQRQQGAKPMPMPRNLKPAKRKAKEGLKEEILQNEWGEPPFSNLKYLYTLG